METEFPPSQRISDTGLTCLAYVCSLPPGTNKISEMLNTIMQNNGGQVKDLADDFGRTPLHHACNSGNLEAVMTLL